MSNASGWRPLREPARDAHSAFKVSAFTRLARVHALAVASDTLTATALAGTLFFSIPTGEARGRVALYLLLTMAPFAIVAPLIGPLLDRARGGRRLMVVTTMGLRALVLAIMIGDVDSLLLFPEAFCALVLSKAYFVAKSALVPTVVDDDTELVRANSRLSLLGGVVGFAAALPGVLALKLVGAELTLLFAAATGVIGAMLALRLPAAQVAPEPAGDAERVELAGSGIVRALAAMGLVRGIVGFLTFLLAFDLRGGGDDGPVPLGLSLGRAARDAAGFPSAGSGGDGGSPAWHFGLVLAASVVGALLSSLLAPRIREAVSEERIIAGSLVAISGVGGLAALRGGLVGSALLAAAVGLSAGVAKLAFDSIVQRDAPDANRGRAFARFETRFQIVWVIGALIPVVVSIPARLGFVVVAAAAAFAASSYLAGSHQAHRPPGRAPVPMT